MAHFAQLDEKNQVLQVIVVRNEDIKDPNSGEESEAVGIAFCRKILGTETNWVQTSYNGTFRKNYAVIGGEYDSVRDAFISPKPFNSWVLDEDTCQWTAPVAYPTDGKPYYWDEPTGSWVEIQTE